MAETTALEQPTIFMSPTIAMHRGDTVVDQCSWCGGLVAWEPTAERKTLGVCPACGCETWWRQDYSSVGPFKGLA